MNSNLPAQNASASANSSAFVHAFLKNLFLVFLGFCINYVNGTLVLTFFRSAALGEEPRYILYVHMVVTDMIQLSVAVALHVVSYALPGISVALCCCLLLVASFTTMTTPLNLAGMAAERYVAVCDPLRHAQVCTPRRTYALIALVWGAGVVPGLADLALVLRYRPLAFFRSTVMCYHKSAFLSPAQELKNGVAHSLYMLFVWLTLIYTYLRVLLAARAASADPLSARKARNTILLHGAQLLLCMLSYVTPRVDAFIAAYHPHLISHVLFLTFLISYVLPRILSPLIYGMRDEKFWKYTRQYWPCVRHRKKKVRP
ncbi:odorant receptor 131-2-like [Anguilla rostrata]|uniref:odorant receptor 131-2-like n=1 Tax=Anguilla rostrata TaxID=7938 RepID=UPI0030D3DB4B